MKNTVIIMLTCFILNACGVKPKTVEGKDGHPRTYPAPKNIDTNSTVGNTATTIPNVRP